MPLYVLHAWVSRLIRIVFYFICLFHCVVVLNQVNATTTPTSLIHTAHILAVQAKTAALCINQCRGYVEKHHAAALALERGTTPDESLALEHVITDMPVKERIYAMATRFWYMYRVNDSEKLVPDVSVKSDRRLHTALYSISFIFSQTTAAFAHWIKDSPLDCVVVGKKDHMYKWIKIGSPGMDSLLNMSEMVECVSEKSAFLGRRTRLMNILCVHEKLMSNFIAADTSVDTKITLAKYLWNTYDTWASLQHGKELKDCTNIITATKPLAKLFAYSKKFHSFPAEFPDGKFVQACIRALTPAPAHLHNLLPPTEQPPPTFNDESEAEGGVGAGNDEPTLPGTMTTASQSDAGVRDNDTTLSVCNHTLIRDDLLCGITFIPKRQPSPNFLISDYMKLCAPSMVGGTNDKPSLVFMNLPWGVLPNDSTDQPLSLEQLTDLASYLFEHLVDGGHVIFLYTFKKLSAFTTVVEVMEDTGFTHSNNTYISQQIGTTFSPGSDGKPSLFLGAFYKKEPFKCRDFLAYLCVPGSGRDNIFRHYSAAQLQEQAKVGKKLVRKQQDSSHLLAHIIIRFSRPQDVVWDLCCGVGSTVRTAALLGRYAVGFDSDHTLAASHDAFLNYPSTTFLEPLSHSEDCAKEFIYKQVDNLRMYHRKNELRIPAGIDVESYVTGRLMDSLADTKSELRPFVHAYMHNIPLLSLVHMFKDDKEFAPSAFDFLDTMHELSVIGIELPTTPRIPLLLPPPKNLVASYIDDETGVDGMVSADENEDMPGEDLQLANDIIDDSNMQKKARTGGVVAGTPPPPSKPTDSPDRKARLRRRKK